MTSSRHARAQTSVANRASSPSAAPIWSTSSSVMRALVV
jgi:hypothetical protein